MLRYVDRLGPSWTRHPLGLACLLAGSVLWLDDCRLAEPSGQARHQFHNGRFVWNVQTNENLLGISHQSTSIRGVGSDLGLLARQTTVAELCAGLGEDGSSPMCPDDVRAQRPPTLVEAGRILGALGPSSLVAR